MGSNKVEQSERPLIINLELTNACNLNCIFCDHPVLRKKMLIIEMDDQLLRRVFSDIKSYQRDERIYELGLVGLGEPTLDRRLRCHLRIIDEYAGMFERISFNSNLVSLGRRQAEILLESNINAYTFSVNASNREAYLKMMGMDRFDLVILNLKTFLKVLANKNKKPRIDIQVFESTQNNIEELKGLFVDMGQLDINFFYRKVYSKPVLRQSTELLSVHRTGIRHRYPCWDIYSRVYIDVEGNLYPCTIGNDSYRGMCNMNLGNVWDDSVIDLFNNRKIKHARRCAEKGRLPFPECRICNIWSLTPNNFKWDKKRQVWRRVEEQVRLYNLKG